MLVCVLCEFLLCWRVGASLLNRTLNRVRFRRGATGKNFYPEVNYAEETAQKENAPAAALDHPHWITQESHHEGVFCPDA
jgi:hypothetical protein